MSFFEYAALKFLLEILKPVLTEKLKDTFKGNNSDVVAKQRAFALFRQLQMLELYSLIFILSLEKIYHFLDPQFTPLSVNWPKQSTPKALNRSFSEDIPEGEKNFLDYLLSSENLLPAHNSFVSNLADLKKELNNNIDNLVRSLKDLVPLIDDIRPQLDIHLPEVISGLTKSIWVRSYLIGETKDTVFGNLPVSDETHKVDIEIIHELINKGRGNLIRISSIIEDFREFLKGEFSFKDSF